MHSGQPSRVPSLFGSFVLSINLALLPIKKKKETHALYQLLLMSVGRLLWVLGQISYGVKEV